jgi:hypothetical protein
LKLRIGIVFGLAVGVRVKVRAMFRKAFALQPWEAVYGSESMSKGEVSVKMRLRIRSIELGEDKI